MNSEFSNRDQLEKRIVLLLAQADRKSIDLIYENYGETLLGLIKRVISNHEAAEEVLQDTFIKIWKNALSYESSKGRLFTWFAQIARNSAIDYARSAKYKQQTKTTSIETFVNKDVLGHSNSEIADSGLRDVIDSLGEKYKVLIDLVYFQGYSQRQIEKEFDIPLGTVKTRLRAAMNELRGKLNPEMVRKLLNPIILIIALLKDLL